MDVDLDAQLALHTAQAKDTQQKIFILEASLRELNAIFERQRGIIQFLQDMKTDVGKGNPKKEGVKKPPGD